MPKSLEQRAALFLVTFLATSLARAEAPLRLADLADLSLEQLSGVTVTSASRREERLVDAPASIFVITNEDIRRSGATNLFEALRLAPNLQVVAGDANQYIATARGGLFGTANKMLMLVDGRTVYTPLFAGVFADAQDLMLADIDRIEVISGAGGTLWGTNAVNGVINVITKTGQRTQGAYVSALGGDAAKRVEARYGAPLGDTGAFRVYALYDNRSANELENGASAHDSSERIQGGFRGGTIRGDLRAVVQGDAYRANVDNLGGPRDISGGNLRGRMSRTLAPGSELMVQAYYDRTERRHAGSFEETMDTVEAEAQHALRYGRANQFVWGGSYRVQDDHTTPTPVLGFWPANRTLRTGSLYAQDEHTLSEAWRATLGLRAEHNVYTGLEWLPTLRLAWSYAPEQMLWSSLSRAVRSPSRIDRDLVVPGFPPFVVTANDTFASEIANVAELGWRGRVGARGTVSLTAFHHRFDDLRTLEPGPGGLALMNGGEGRTSGVEGWGDLRLHERLRLVGGFVAMSNKFELKPGHVDLSSDKIGNNPKRTATLRALWNATPTVEADVGLRYSAALPNPVVPAYTVVDVRLGWRLQRDLDVSVGVRNLFDREHAEIGAPASRAVFGRTSFLRVTWSP